MRSSAASGSRTGRQLPKGTYLQAQYQRLDARRGHGRGTTAVAHSILVAAWHILTTGEPYVEPDGDYLARRNPERTTND
jgi:transposase